MPTTGTPLPTAGVAPASKPGRGRKAAPGRVVSETPQQRAVRLRVAAEIRALLNENAPPFQPVHAFSGPLPAFRRWKAGLPPHLRPHAEAMRPA